MSKLILGLAFIVSLSSFNSAASGAFPRHKFETWFPGYAPNFHNASIGNCSKTLQIYKHPGVGEEPTRLTISRHAACILDNVSEIVKANMASAGVVLGLMPGLISVLGPTVAESSLLMIERPFLASLLAIGSPALYSTLRPFGHQGPLEGLHQPSKSLPSIPSTRWAHVLISLLQYLLALAAAMNVVVASLELGLKTVVTWKKDASYLPFIWVVLPLGIHLCAAVKLRWSLGKVKTPHEVMFSPVTNIRQQTKSPEPSSRAWQRPINLLVAETRLCIEHGGYQVPPSNETFLAYVLSALLPATGIVHLFLGTMIFSSLLFIAVDDTWRIVLRFAMSAVVAQLIRLFEIAGLQYAHKKMGGCDECP